MRTRSLTIIAQDPSVTAGGEPILGTVYVPAERLEAGPRGYRVAVVDYDATRKVYYPPLPAEAYAKDDPFEGKSAGALIADPRFHAQNVYALVMCTLSRFEFALGRRVGWSMEGHQLKVAPHALREANAFYSERDEALIFGYFPSARDPKRTIFTCLAHDVVAHETTHALIDGLRTRFSDLSASDQLAFHEGFSDMVALLSQFTQPRAVEAVLAKRKGSDAKITPETIRRSRLFDLAEQVGSEIENIRGKPLRRSLELPPGKDYLKSPEFTEPHRRGEVFTAAMLTAFIESWAHRAEHVTGWDRIISEGAAVADHLLIMAIRALDYMPVVDVTFEEFLSAALTADARLHPDDDKYGLRAALSEAFGRYGIAPASRDAATGEWQRFDGPLLYDRVHHDPMMRDRDEVFRFLWENAAALEIHPRAFTRVLSVRSAMRQGPDGFFLRENVVEYLETLTLRGKSLGLVDVEKPKGLADDAEVRLHGGGTLVFDEFGGVVFHVKTRLGGAHQSRRVKRLFEEGALDRDRPPAAGLSQLHLRRAANP